MDLVRQRTYAGMGQHFATLDQALPDVSDEHVHIDAPVFGRQAFKDLAVAQGKLQRTEAGSKRRAKAPMVRARSRTARLAARCRTWQQHLAIARTARAHLVGVQTLSLKGMARRKKGCRFARSVADDGYGQLVQVLTRQADKRGCAVVQADRVWTVM